jgi:ribosomal protein L16 Arg81 hydroxylase
VADGDFSDEAAIQAYLEAGQPIVWNAARGASAALDSLTAEITEALGAHVWANVYSTGSAMKPFQVHFDAHDVLAVQCEGAKEWMVSKVRLNCPLDVPALAPTVRRALEERRAEAQAEPLMTVVTEPGDVLYIPRGQFHDARTPEDRSLHVTFAIAPPTGIDVIQALGRLALGEALFRDYLPHPLVDGDGSLTRSHLAALADRLAQLARSDALRQALDAWPRMWLQG